MCHWYPTASIVSSSGPPRGKNRVPTVGFVYTGAPRKTCNVASEAFRIASQRIPGLRLVVFGSHGVIPELPLPPAAEFHVRPPQAKLRELYAKCDAWLFSSKTEGFGLPILEAMACRTPVIGTPAGAAPELIADGGGILVAPDDPTDMHEPSSGHRPERTRMGRMSDVAFNTASRYSWDNAVELFEAALRPAIEKQNRPQEDLIAAEKRRTAALTSNRHIPHEARQASSYGRNIMKY